MRYKLQHLDEYENLMVKRIRELSPPLTDDIGANTYRAIVMRYFFQHNSIRRRRLAEGKKLIGSRAKPVTKAFRELWVVKAEKESTYEVFEGFQQFEKLLFQSPEYRGHYVHQFDVFLLGHYILNKMLKECDRISQKLRVSNNPNFTWMLASTFHDMGYPIEQIENWFSHFLRMFLKVDVPFQIDIEKILSQSFYDYLGYLSEWHYAMRTGTIAVSGRSIGRDWKFHEKLQTSLRRKDHGVISSLLLMHSLLTQEKISLYRNWFVSIFPYEILPACHAISVHNLGFEDFKIGLSTYPYAFLLTLCDVLQDWRRCAPGKDYSELKDFNFRCRRSFPILEFKLKINLPKKEKEIIGLQEKLTTNGLMEVSIQKENGDSICSLE